MTRGEAGGDDREAGGNDREAGGDDRETGGDDRETGGNDKGGARHLLVSFPTFLIGNPRFFLQAGDTQMKGQKQDHGFPLKTGGNDRRGTGGNDKRGDRRE